MTSSDGFDNRPYSPDPPVPTILGGDVIFLSPHSINQCMQRCDTDRDNAIITICRTAAKGVQWETPKGLGLRDDNAVIGIAPYRDREGHLQHGLAVLTFYFIDMDGGLRNYANEIKARNRMQRPQTRKPGRQRAWERLHRQGKHCRKPPVRVEGFPEEP